MDHDVELLRRYADTGSHDAFAAIVRRHVDVVYTAARRYSGGDAELADEITQRVFVLLATKARSLGEGVLLGGWLYNAVRFVTRDIQRSEHRRAKHEQEAAARMQRDVTNDSHTHGYPDDARTSAEAALDDAIADLDEQARGLLVLRFFQGKTAREVGSMLGISEEAARKRVSRAVDELRGIFARRGVVISAVGLTETLAAVAILQAPAHVTAAAAAAAGVTGAATAAVATSASATAASATSAASTTAGAFKGWAAVMALTKAQSAVATVAGIILVGGGLVIGGAKVIRAVSSPSSPPLVAAPTATTISGPTISGIVRGPDGAPVVDAEIDVGTRTSLALAYPGRGRRRTPAVVTDAAGKYTAPQPAEPFVLVVRSAKGYAEIRSSQLALGADVTLRAWGRIEGLAKEGERPVANARVGLWRVPGLGNPFQGLVHHETEVNADALGHYVFAQVAPGGVLLNRRISETSRRSDLRQYAHVEPGETIDVPLGGSGRGVVGTIQTPPELADLVVWTEEGDRTYQAEVRQLDLPPEHPQHAAGETPDQYRAVEEAHGRTQAGKFARSWMFGREFMVQPDGAFRIADLPAGKYRLTVRSFETDDEVRFSEDVARTEVEFKISPQDASLHVDLDVGTLVAQPVPRLRPGAIGPDFSVITIDGKTWKLADHRGKPFVLVLWGAYGDRDEDMKGFTELARRWGNDNRVAILGSFVANNVEAAKKSIADYRMDFPHTADHSLMNLYHCSWPSAVVVGADGRVMQKHLKGELLDRCVERAVAEAASTTTRPASR